MMKCPLPSTIFFQFIDGSGLFKHAFQLVTDFDIGHTLI